MLPLHLSLHCPPSLLLIADSPLLISCDGRQHMQVTEDLVFWRRVLEAASSNRGGLESTIDPSHFIYRGLLCGDALEAALRSAGHIQCR
eukprot:SAG11_NODE_7456_length_1141_cov_1.201536_2_plen_89_part_00